MAGALWLASCSASSAPEEDWPAPSPALWEVTSPGGQTGWVFGTVHALPDDLEWRTSTLEDAIATSGVLVVEIADLDDPSGAALFADLSETPGQPPLSSRVDDDERADLLVLMEDADMEDSDFSRIESWAAAMMLSSQVRSGGPRNGVDRALTREAAEVIGLETISGQLSLFDGLSNEAQADLLHGVALSHAANTSQQVLRAWLTGDEAQLIAHVNQSLDVSRELRRVLLTERNARWLEDIVELVERGRRPLVAVGAGHVIGEDGLVALLQARGFEVRRIE
nr:TraB/GumN family protein [Aurantiacibacter sp. 219JJ12-13]MDP5262057.1 TraB/GumN family protein [Aurantiacibacter sp. 219JJ12-13]